MQPRTPLMCSADGYAQVYTAEPGDSLYKIIRDQYGITGAAAEPVLRAVLKQNPSIKVANQIQIGQAIMLQFPWDRQVAAPPLPREMESAVEQWNAMQRNERQTAANIAGALGATRDVMGAGGDVLNAFDLLIKNNKVLLHEVVKNFELYKAGGMSKYAYSSSRTSLLNRFGKNLGSFEKTILKGQGASEAFRMSPGRARQPQMKFNTQVARLGKMAKAANTAGHVLTVANLGLACMQIAHAEDQLQKDKVFIETSVGTAVGLGAPVLVAALVTGPVGWGVALLLFAGVAATSYLAGKGASHYYERNYGNMRISETLGITAVCN